MSTRKRSGPHGTSLRLRSDRHHTQEVPRFDRTRIVPFFNGVAPGRKANRGAEAKVVDEFVSVALVPLSRLDDPLNLFGL